MDRTVIRNAGLSLALCAGLGFGAMAAVPAFAAESTTTEDEAAATATAEDTEAAEEEATDEASDTEAAAGSYADGEYTASGKGIGGDVPVTVTVKDGAIESVEVGDNSETQGIGSNAIEQLPDLIVEANGTDGVDGVSGATVTSNAIFTAVDDCLEQASAGDTAKADDAEATDEETADKADADKGTDKASADKTSTTDKAAADEETGEK